MLGRELESRPKRETQGKGAALWTGPWGRDLGARSLLHGNAGPLVFPMAPHSLQPRPAQQFVVHTFRAWLGPQCSIILVSRSRKKPMYTSLSQRVWAACLSVLSEASQ